MQSYLELLRLFIGVAIALFMGSVCAKQARKKGRNPTVWFWVGALCGLMGLLIILLLPSSFKKKSVMPIQKEEEPLFPNEIEHKQKLWYYLDKEEKAIGPMSFSVLESSLLDGKIAPETLVWNEDMDNWQELKSFLTLTPV